MYCSKYFFSIVFNSGFSRNAATSQHSPCKRKIKFQFNHGHIKLSVFLFWKSKVLWWCDWKIFVLEMLRQNCIWNQKHYFYYSMYFANINWVKRKQSQSSSWLSFKLRLSQNNYICYRINIDSIELKFSSAHGFGVRIYHNDV